MNVKQFYIIIVLSMFLSACVSKGKAGKSDKLIMGEIIEFEQSIKPSNLVLSYGCSWKKSKGFESEVSLSIIAPKSAENSANYYFKDISISSLATPHFRITYWMKVAGIHGRGGAGIIMLCLDKNGKEIAVNGKKELYRKTEKMNKWQKIDHLKDSRWQSYSMETDVPVDTASITIKAGLFDCSGKVTIDRIIIRNTPSVNELLTNIQTINAEISNKVIKPMIHPLLFSVNMEYFFRGSYDGTLSEDDKRNKRKQYAKALKQAGIRAIRFPGGMPAHHYFAEGKQYQRKYFNGKGPWFVRASYVEFDDIMKFCRDFDFEMIYQTNSMSFVDKKGQIRAITNNKRVKKNPSRYDHNRVDEAAAALGRLIDMIPRGFKIKYWEIGNEDFALMSVEEYATIVSAYSKMIKSKIPDAVIIVTGNVWPVELCEKLKKSGVINDIQYLALHYPWGDHWLPEKGKKDANKDLKRFVMGELNWEINLNAHKKMLAAAGFPDMKFAGTETNVFKFHKWHSHSVIYTPAQALLLAHNWIEAMKIKNLDILTYHNLDSTFFGMIYYNCYYDSKRKKFVSIPKKMKKCPDEIPVKYFYKDKYVLLPSAKVFGLLSKHAGLPMLKSTIVTPDKVFQRNYDIIVSTTKQKLLVTMLNRAAKPREVNLSFKDIKVGEEAIASGFHWKSLGMLPGNDMKINRRIKISGNKLKLELKAFSVMQLKIPLKGKMEKNND